MRRLRGVVVVAGVLAALAGTHAANGQVFERADELQSRVLVNVARAAAGVAPLAESPELDKMARAQAARMAARGEIYHNPNLGSDATASGLQWVRVGENVGVGPDIPIIHAAFLASPHHRDNLLFPQYTIMGLGVVPGTGDKSGMIFVAHVFAQLAGSAAPRVAPPARPAPVHTASPVAIRTAIPVVRPVETAPPAPTATPNAVIGGVVDPSAVIPD